MTIVFGFIAASIVYSEYFKFTPIRFNSCKVLIMRVNSVQWRCHDRVDLSDRQLYKGVRCNRDICYADGARCRFGPDGFLPRWRWAALRLRDVDRQWCDVSSG